MNGPQDLGGRHGFGPVAPVAGAPLFHADWERRAFALTLAAGALGHWTLDESRHARESLPPATYYAASYYEIWTRALEALLLRHELVTADELAAGDAAPAPAPHPKRLEAGAVAATLARGGPTERDPAGTRPAFRPGDRIRTRLMNPEHHNRLPAYARGRAGAVEAVQGFHVFPDSHAHGQGEAPQWLYTIVFAGRDLWGSDADPRLAVSIDAWESYLEPA